MDTGRSSKAAGVQGAARGQGALGGAARSAEVAGSKSAGGGFNPGRTPLGALIDGSAAGTALSAADHPRQLRQCIPDRAVTDAFAFGILRSTHAALPRQ